MRRRIKGETKAHVLKMPKYKYVNLTVITFFSSVARCIAYVYVARSYSLEIVNRIGQKRACIPNAHVR